MLKLRRKLALGALIAFCLSLGVFGGGTAFAADPEDRPDSERATLLPVTTEKYSSIAECKKLMNYIGSDKFKKDDFFSKNGAVESAAGLAPFTQSDVLGCGIKTGSIRLWMVAYYVRYILEFAIQIAGLVAVGGIVYGGYLYLFTGVSDDKEKGKKAIMYSVAGMVLTMVAWAAVNIVIGFLTG